MGKKELKAGGSGSVTLGSITPRQKPKGNKQSHVNAKLMLKLEHIKNLAVWASGEASIPSLGAFFGNRLAASSEALGLPPEPSLFSCQRCESVLQPGYNCTVRVEKNDAKARRRNKKPRNSPQNYVVYNCQFCSHRNLRRGTARGYLKQICPPKDRPSTKVEHPKSSTTKSSKPMTCPPKDRPSTKVEHPKSSTTKSSEPMTVAASNNKDSKIDIVTSPEIVQGDHMDSKIDIVTSPEIVQGDHIALPADEPSTPSLRMDISLLDSKRKRRNKSGLKKPVESESISTATDVDQAICTSNKRKRKSWVTLKEMAQSSGQDKSTQFSNISVPFFL
nr:Ribonuclease P protein component 4 like [Ipomoea batatas]